MKRVCVVVDLEENDLFEKEVLEAVKAEARRVAREAVSAEISAECSRIVQKWIKDKSSYGYVGKLERHMKEKVEEEIKKELGTIVIDPRMVDERIDVVLGNIDKRVDDIIGRRLDRVGFGEGSVSVREYIKGMVERTVKSLVPETILNLLVSGMKGKEE